MNRWANKPTTKLLALAAAIALAIAPVDLLAACGCAACGCAAAADDTPGCCCKGNSHGDRCCDISTPDNCCQAEATPAPGGCNCTFAVPESPVGTLPHSGSPQTQQLAAIPLALVPPSTAIGPNPSLTAPQDQPLWPVPVRILLCVWRN